MIDICKACQQEKELAPYRKVAGGKIYFRPFCQRCWSSSRKEYNANWVQKHADRLKVYHAKKYVNNFPAIQANAKRHYEKWKKIVYDHYGTKCSCCGESEQRFLTIDHVNNDGAEQRKKIGQGSMFFRWLFNNNFPSDYRILCFNCNAGRFHNGGECPHNNPYLSQGDFKVIQPYLALGI